MKKDRVDKGGTWNTGEMGGAYRKGLRKQGFWRAPGERKSTKANRLKMA